MNKKEVLMENKNKKLKNGVRLAYKAPVLSVLPIKGTRSGATDFPIEDPHLNFYGPHGSG
jgi:hypothetical protein